MNDSFSWRRLGLVARADLAGERRAWALRAGCGVLFCIMLYIAWNTDALLGRENVHDGYGYVVPRLILGVGLVIAVLFNISRSFRNYSSHGRAVEAFMLPAARNEKFVWAVLKNFVAVPLILVAIVGLNDLFWAEWLGFDSLFSLVAEGWRTLMEEGFRWSWILLIVLYGLHYMATMAFFLAGAAVFRRHPFLWTILVQFVLCNPVSSMLILTPFLISGEWSETFGVMVLDLIALGVCVLWVYIAWWRFSKLQLKK